MNAAPPFQAVARGRENSSPSWLIVPHRLANGQLILFPCPHLSTSVHICPLPNGSLPSTCSPLWESCSPHWENKPRLKNCYTKWHRQLVPGNQQSGGQFQKSMTSFHPISDPRSPTVPYIYICIEHQESKLGNTNTWIKCKVDHSSRFFEFWSSSLSGCPVLV